VEHKEPPGLSARLAHVSKLLTELRQTTNARRQRELTEEVTREIDSALEALKPYRTTQPD
jgi:hypothetical protein